MRMYALTVKNRTRKRWKIQQQPNRAQIVDNDVCPDSINFDFF
ncbi:unnamed protein product, partial [Allacma fusca]